MHKHFCGLSLQRLYLNCCWNDATVGESLTNLSNLYKPLFLSLKLNYM